MNDPEDLRVQAERLCDERSLRKLSRGITEPAAKSVAEQFASGSVSARDVVSTMVQSAPLIRNLDRCVDRLMRLSPEEIEAMSAQRDRQVDSILAELRAAARPRRPPRQDDDEEEESFENESWLR
jgi:hypothetical protein